MKVCTHNNFKDRVYTFEPSFIINELGKYVPLVRLICPEVTFSVSVEDFNKRFTMTEWSYEI